MKKFEYLSIESHQKSTSVKTLDKYGKKGWELINVISIGSSIYYYFKRIIK